MNRLDRIKGCLLYRDSLRWGGRRPDLSLLLVPREGSVPALEKAEFVEANGVGVAVLSVEEDGLGAMLERFGVADCTRLADRRTRETGAREGAPVQSAMTLTEISSI